MSASAKEIYDTLLETYFELAKEGAVSKSFNGKSWTKEELPKLREEMQAWYLIAVQRGEIFDPNAEQSIIYRADTHSSREGGF